jgi:GNAT superfamily N-acetyltransferase
VVTSQAERRAAREPRVHAAFGSDAYAALDLLDLADYAWHDCYGEPVPDDVVDDLLVIANGSLDALARTARLAVQDFRDVRVRADGVRTAPLIPDDHGIRPAGPADVPAIVALITELATYERSAHEVTATPDLLRAALFGPEPAAFCHVAEAGGEVVGFALWFRNFSTWHGRHGIYLEDLYVRPEHRGAGIGKALLLTLARIARERGYPRVEWAVLDWNEPAQAFYRSLGAAPMDEWTVWRLAP